MHGKEVLVDCAEVEHDEAEDPGNENSQGSNESVPELQSDPIDSNTKLEKVVTIPKDVSSITPLKSVKIDIEQQNGAAGISSGWYIVSVMLTTCCVLPWVMLSRHLKDVKKRRAHHLKMKQVGCVMALTVFSGAVIIVLLVLLGNGVSFYQYFGNYWMSREDYWDYRVYQDWSSGEAQWKRGDAVSMIRYLSKVGNDTQKYEDAMRSMLKSANSDYRYYY